MAGETKQTTKEAIISAARKLFVEKGYDSVGMRDIATVLSISVGNLTYHFKKKEDLLEAVVVDFCNRYVPHPTCRTLEELDDLLRFFERLNEENLFYFSNYTRMSRVSEQVRAMQRRVFLDNTIMWVGTLNILCETGLIQPEEYEGRFAGIGNTIHFMKVSWYEREDAEREMGVAVSRFSQAAWDILFPMLTDKGREIYLTKIKKFGGAKR